jgi:ankyrin repeat protein
MKLLKSIGSLAFLLLASATLHAQAIFEAIKKNDLAEVTRLIMKDSSLVYLKDDMGNSPLHIAVGLDNTGMAELLISRGASVDERDKDGQTTFLLAARNTGNVGMGKLLRKNGADINASDAYSYLPLNWSAFFNNKEFVDFLLDQGAVFDTTGGKTFHMLYFAARDGSVRLFKTVSEKGNDLFAREATNDYIMRIALAGGSIEIVRMLVEKNIPIKHDANVIGWTPLHYAAKSGFPAMIEFLAEQGADINKRTLSGKSAYNIAKENNQTESLQMILKLGGDTSVQQFPNLRGPYLGQAPPDKPSRTFAPDIATPNHSSITISPDGEEIYWASDSYIMFTRMQKDCWTRPDTVSFSKSKKVGANDDVPFISPDGKRMLFTSTRPIGSDSTGKENIWISTRKKNGWTNPKPVSKEVNMMQLHWQVSVSNNGTLYFGGMDKDYYGGNGDIFYSLLVNGRYAKPVNMGPVINGTALESMPYIAPDESYIIFSRQTNTDARSYDGFCISFKGREGQWLPPVSLEAYTREGVCPSVSPDGKYFFYLHSGGTVHWMNAGFIEELRPSGSLEEVKSNTKRSRLLRNRPMK